MALLSLTVTCHIAVCVRITWYHTWMMEAKMVLCGGTTPHPLSSAQRNQQKWPFMHCVWVLNRVTLTWAHLNIMYLCNELELELFWTDGTNYCLSYFELDRSSSRSTLCQMVDRRFLMPVLFTIDLCQWFLLFFFFLSLQFLFSPAVLLQLMLSVCSTPPLQRLQTS